VTEDAGTLGSLYTVGDIMSSFKPPMGEGNTGSFDTPFGGKGGPSGEFAPPIPPAPKAEGAAFTPSVPKIEGAKFTPPVPPAPKTPQEGFEGDSSETEKGGRGNSPAKSRGDSGRPKSTRRMWPWIAAVAVVAVVSGVLGYGYFANEGNNPVGEKLGFSHAKVTDQSTSDPNNGSYTNPSGDANSSQQGQEGSAGQQGQVPNSNATTRAESGTDSLTDSDYGKEVVSHIRSSNRELGYYTALFQDYKAQYVPNNTAESFVESAGKLKYADKYYSLTASGDTMRVERRTTIPSDEYLKYELMSDVVGEYGIPILSLAYESGVPDPKIDVALYDETNNSLVYELKNLSLKGKIEDYFFSIPGTDVNLWKEVLFPDGYTEG
jgi:hypothetical protein